jgi:hypothetical protein
LSHCVEKLAAAGVAAFNDASNEDSVALETLDGYFGFGRDRDQERIQFAGSEFDLQSAQQQWFV